MFYIYFLFASDVFRVTV